MKHWLTAVHCSSSTRRISLRLTLHGWSPTAGEWSTAECPSSACRCHGRQRAPWSFCLSPLNPDDDKWYTITTTPDGRNGGKWLEFVYLWCIITVDLTHFESKQQMMPPGWAADWCHRWPTASPSRNRFQATAAGAFWECPLRHSVRLIHRWVLNSSWVITAWLMLF